MGYVQSQPGLAGACMSLKDARQGSYLGIVGDYLSTSRGEGSQPEVLRKVSRALIYAQALQSTQSITDCISELKMQIYHILKFRKITWSPLLQDSKTLPRPGTPPPGRYGCLGF